MRPMVIKKSLSLLTAISLALTLFTSVAFAADTAVTPPTPTPTASSTKATTMDAQAKFDALKEKGIFDGIDDKGTAGLDKEMTRAQLAKIVVVLNGLKEDASSSAVYTDLDGAGWAAGFIGAATKAGYMEGVAADQFNPSGTVTIEQVAMVMVRVLKLTVDNAATVTGTVADWAKESVAAAIKAGLVSSTTDYTHAANRELLVNAAYTAYQTLVGGPVVTNVSVAEFKATGAKTLWVKLNGSIADTSKLTVSILSGGSNGAVAAGTQKWNIAKNEVTITLNAKLMNGIYSVKLDAVKDGGLTIEKGTANVTVTDEKVIKIDFTTASDTIAQGKIKIGFKAINQYNEVADLSAARFNIITSPDLGALVAGDSQTLTIDTASAVSSNKLAKGQMFSVTVLSPDFLLNVNKSFKIGDAQLVGKVELGDIAYAYGKTNLEAGDFASLAYKAYDQYGFQIIDLGVLTKYTLTTNTGAGIIDAAAVTPVKGFGFVADETGDGIPDLKVKAVPSYTITSDQDVSLSVISIGTGDSVSKVMKIIAPKTPYDISFGSYTGMIAVGDDDVFIPITVKDQAGNALSIDDIVSNANKIILMGSGTSAATVGVVNSAGTALVGGIEKSGANKGKIRISTRLNQAAQHAGTLTVTALINTSGKSATWTTSIQEKRYPATVFTSVVPKAKILPSIDLNYGRTETATRIKFRDQYGEEFYRDYRGYTVQLDFGSTSGSVTDGVYLFKGGYTSDYRLTTILLDGGDGSVDGYNPPKNPPAKGIPTDIDAYRDQDMIFVANVGDNNQGNYQLTAKLFKGDRAAVTAGTAPLMSTAVSSVQLIKAKEADNLSYTITPFTSGLYAIDKLKGPQGTSSPFQVTSQNVVADTSGTVTKYVYTTEAYALENMFAGKIVLTAKDAAGNIVQIPNNAIKSVSVSNPEAATVVVKTKPDGAVPNSFDGFGIRGKEVGTTNAVVAFQPSIYSGYKFATLENIAIKDEPLSISALTATFNGKAKTIWLSTLKAGINIFQANGSGRLNQTITFSNISMNDQYAENYFKNSSITRVASLFGIQTLISNVRWTSENIAPGSGYLAVESNISGVNSVNGLSNATYSLVGPDANGKYYDPMSTASPAVAIDPADWVFTTTNPAIRLNRGDMKYAYTPAKSAVDGSDVEVASFTVTMLTGSGKFITVDVYVNPANAKY